MTLLTFQIIGTEHSVSGASGLHPRWSKYRKLEDPGPKNNKWYGFWNQKPQMLGTWTLWGPHGVYTAAVSLSCLRRVFTETCRVLCLLHVVRSTGYEAVGMKACEGYV